MTLMDKIRLYPLDLTVTSNVSSLSDLLASFIPFSLPVLGALFQRIESISPYEAVAAVHVWTSFPLDEPSGTKPSLFSVILQLPLEDKTCRYFCSDDTSLLPPTPTAEAHVIEVIRQFVHIIDPIYAVHIAIPEIAEPRPTIICGAVHDRWSSCLEKYHERTNPCIHFLHAPQQKPPATNSTDNVWTLNPLQEADVDLVLNSSHIPRTRNYLLSRFPTSVCARAAGGDGSDSPQKPIGWVLMHADGSIGSLHVAPSYRKKGIARMLMQELIRTTHSDNLGGAQSTEKAGGAFGWNWVDVVAGNNDGLAFYRNLDGWEEAWVCHWTAFSHTSIMKNA